MKKKITAFIIEDDNDNINLLKLLIQKYFPNIEIIGEASNTIEFASLLLSNKADIIFLDVDLGEQKNTLEILNDFENIDSEIIITSSSKDYALKAMNDYNIVSYVVKPIDIGQLNKAIRKSEKKIAAKEKFSIDSFQFDILAENIIAIPTLTTIEIIDIKNIIYLEAEGKYTIFHLLDKTTKTVCKNIGYYEHILPQKLFFRIHHKYLINISETDTIFRTDGHYCILKNGKNIPIAKRRIEDFRKYLQLK